MGWKHYQTVDHRKREPQVGSRLFGIRLLLLHFKFSIFQIHQIFNISYFPQFNLSFEKKISLSQNHPKIYAKPPNSAYGYKHRDLALLETRARYWQKGHVTRRQNSLHVYTRLNRERTGERGRY